MTANSRLLHRCPGRLYIFVSGCSWVYPPVLVSLAIEARPAGFQVVTQQESWKFLSAHISSQNHYRDHDAGDDQAKGYGARDNFKFVPVLCEMQAWEQQFPKIIFQHEKPLIGIKFISAPIPF